MAIQVTGTKFGRDGHKETVAATLRANVDNTNGVLNVLEGKDPAEPRPVYDPKHPDNQWPVMRYHESLPDKQVGKSLLGVTDPNQRAAILKANEAEDASLGKLGYRAKPYPVIRAKVLDPGQEKAAQLERERELHGKNAALADQLANLQAKVDALLAAK